MIDSKELIQEFRDAREAYQTLVKKKGKLLLKAVFTQMFEAVPQLKRVGWEQGTPSFNDGDPCMFSVRERFFDCGVEDENTDNEADLYEWAELPWMDNKNELDAKWNGATKASVKQLAKLNETLEEMEDVLQEVFGDSVQVIAKKNKKGAVTFTTDYCSMD